MDRKLRESEREWRAFRSIDNDEGLLVKVVVKQCIPFYIAVIYMYAYLFSLLKKCYTWIIHFVQYSCLIIHTFVKLKRKERETENNNIIIFSCKDAWGIQAWVMWQIIGFGVLIIFIVWHHTYVIFRSLR